MLFQTTLHFLFSFVWLGTVFVAVVKAQQSTSSSTTGLFPITIGLQYGRPATSNNTLFIGSPCNLPPPTSTLPQTLTVLVKAADNWTTIAQEYGISVNKLLLMNKIYYGDVMNAATGEYLLNPLPGTYVVVNAFPNIEPECTCFGEFPIYSDDFLQCIDPYTQSSRTRLLSNAYVPSLVTSISTYSFWEAKTTAPNAFVSDLYIDLQFIDELFEVDFIFALTSALPAQVEMYVATLANDSISTALGSLSSSSQATSSATLTFSTQPISTFTETITRAQTLGEGIWSRAILWQPQVQTPCSNGFPFCFQLARIFSSAIIPPTSQGTSTISGNLLRFRFFSDATQTNNLQVKRVRILTDSLPEIVNALSSNR